jgi:hypothetical protein
LADALSAVCQIRFGALGHDVSTGIEEGLLGIVKSLRSLLHFRNGCFQFDGQGFGV